MGFLRRKNKGNSAKRQSGLMVIEKHRKAAQKNKHADHMSIHDSCSELKYQMEYCKKMEKYMREKEQEELIQAMHTAQQQREEAQRMEAEKEAQALNAQREQELQQQQQRQIEENLEQEPILGSGFLDTLTEQFSCGVCLLEEKSDPPETTIPSTTQTESTKILAENSAMDLLFNDDGDASSTNVVPGSATSLS